MMPFKIELDSQKGGITNDFFFKYGKIKIDLYDSLPLEKKLTLHNVIILIKSVFNKEQNHYYYNKFLEKYSNQLTKKQLQ